MLVECVDGNTNPTSGTDSVIDNIKGNTYK